MFTVLRPESTLSAPPKQSERVRYQNQSTNEHEFGACVLKLVPGSICRSVGGLGSYIFFYRITLE